MGEEGFFRINLYKGYHKYQQYIFASMHHKQNMTTSSTSNASEKEEPLAMRL